MIVRDRRALLIGGLTVATAILGLRVLPWSVGHAKRSYATLKERADLLGRTREELTSLPTLRDSAATLSQALVALAPQVLSGTSPADAGADLSGWMNLAASRSRAHIDRLDVVPDSNAVGRLARVRIHAAMETDVRGLVGLLRMIDSGDQVLKLEELHVEASEPASLEHGPERLKVELTVSGWYLKPHHVEDRKLAT